MRWTTARTCHRAGPRTRAETRVGNRSERLARRAAHTPAQARGLRVRARVAPLAPVGHSGCSIPNLTVAQWIVSEWFEFLVSPMRQNLPGRSERIQGRQTRKTQSHTKFWPNPIEQSRVTETLLLRLNPFDSKSAGSVYCPKNIFNPKNAGTVVEVPSKASNRRNLQHWKDNRICHPSIKPSRPRGYFANNRAHCNIFKTDTDELHPHGGGSGSSASAPHATSLEVL